MYVQRGKDLETKYEIKVISIKLDKLLSATLWYSYATLRARAFSSSTFISGEIFRSPITVELGKEVIEHISTVHDEPLC